MPNKNVRIHAPKANERKTLGERLREARDYVGYSQEEIAAYLKMPRSAVSLIETGQRKLDALELKKLAELYKRPVSHFTEDDLIEAPLGTDVNHLARTLSGLSEEDLVELGRFADFLRSNKDRSAGKKS